MITNPTINSKKLSFLGILVLGLSIVLVARAHEAHQTQDAVIVEFIQKMVEKHQFSQEELTVLMDNAKKRTESLMRLTSLPRLSRGAFLKNYMSQSGGKKKV